MKRIIAGMKAQHLYLDGTALSMKGQYAKAIELLTRAIETRPNFYDAFVHRGIAYLESGNAKEALADLSTAIQGDPKNALSYYNRSIAFMELGDSDSALSDMDQAIKWDPKNANNFVHRSIIQSRRRNFDAAVRDATEAISLGAGKDGYHNRAIILEKKEEFSAAIEDWGKVLEYDSRDVKAYCLRGRLYAKMEMKDKAVLDLQKGLKQGEELNEKLQKESRELLQKIKEERN
jgi:tetratricopeptide (TPR) repeat protein